MKLLPKSVARTLPSLDAVVEERDPLVRVKLFDAFSQWTWYCVAFDGTDTVYALARGLEDELGYFSLDELSKVRNCMGLGIERDLYFEPQRLSEIRRQLAATELQPRRTRTTAEPDALQPGS